MNKILVDGEILYLDKDEVELEVKGISKIMINNHDFPMKLKIIMDNHASLEIYDFNQTGQNMSVEVFQNGDSKVCYTHTFKAKNSYTFYYRAYMEGFHNENIVHITGVSLGQVFMDVDGIVSRFAKKNKIDESIRILTLGGHAEILPKLHISTLEVEANHNTAISNLREDVMFYLMSRGIKQEKCEELISESYLYGLFQHEEEFLKSIKK